MMKCIYVDSPACFLKKNACPRENQCLFAGELKTRMKLKKKKSGAASGQRFLRALYDSVLRDLFWTRLKGKKEMPS